MLPASSFCKTKFRGSVYAITYCEVSQVRVVFRHTLNSHYLQLKHMFFFLQCHVRRCIMPSHFFLVHHYPKLCVTWINVGHSLIAVTLLLYLYACSSVLISLLCINEKSFVSFISSKPFFFYVHTLINKNIRIYYRIIFCLKRHNILSFVHSTYFFKDADYLSTFANDYHYVVYLIIRIICVFFMLSPTRFLFDRPRATCGMLYWLANRLKIFLFKYLE